MRLVRVPRASVLSVFAGAAVFAASAHAQQFPSCPLTTNGPDVICGDIQGTQNYPLVGTLDAVALGSISCNVGNATLNWLSGTVNHPLIGGGVYKYAVVAGAGRFEMLGQSWVKHASSAFQQNLCCANCAPTDGQHLGTGCSDPYTASRNGGQFSLGPKFQVNPNTGAYSAAHPSPTGGNNGRVQMAVSDLEPSSASVRYFGEMMYVALDDARANNNDNNSCYRELSVATAASTASGFDFNVLGITARMVTAVEAWAVVDPGVSLQSVLVPEDSVAPYDGTGRVLLAARVTALGGGTWHYEYALENQNSDRSIASFRVPIPAGAVITNVGFHDVAYLGGDGVGSVNYDGTDWTATLAGGELRWETTPFATNANANALRWGTTYNFRFDANLAPGTSSATLGQFKVVNDVLVANVPGPVDGAAFEAFCSGDGSFTDHTTACPCGNNGAPGFGCAHSAHATGARLDATGSHLADDVVLAASEMPGTAFAIYLQHDATGDAVFHDGVLCASGNLVRLRGRASVGGASTFPNSTDTQTLSQRGGVTPGSGVRRYYSTFFRNAAPTFCPPATANVTNGWKIDW